MSHDFPDGPDYNPEPIDDDPWDVDTDTSLEATEDDLSASDPSTQE